MPQQQADTSKLRSNPQPSAPTGSGAPPGNEAADAFKSGISRNAQELSSEITHVASDVAGQAKHLAESKLHDGKNFAGDQLGAVASALHSTSDVLRSKDSAITDYVEKAAKSIDDVSIYLGTRTLAQLINDVEGFARREPAMFLGGAFFAGLMGGRFLKAMTPTSAPKSPQEAPESGASATSGSSAPKKEATSSASASASSSSRKDEPAGAQAQPPTKSGHNGGESKP